MVPFFWAFLAGVAAQIGEIEDGGKGYSWAKAILAHPLTAILACVGFGLFIVLGLVYLKRVLDRMREVEVIVKTKNIVKKKESKLLLKEEVAKSGV